MEVKEPEARYLTAVQRSELGEFPADWRVVPLGKFEPFITSGSRGWAAYYADIGSTFLRITNLSRSCIYPSLKDLRYVAVPPDNSEGVRTALQAGDILISITADIGIVGLVTEAIELPAYINQHIALVRFAARDANSRYVAYFLAGAAAQRRFKSMTDAGAKAGMNLAGVREVLAALPPSTDEQAAIAEALTDADALIGSLEQLLTKKRQIKRGAMQGLLTGKRRLPGSRLRWEHVSLSKVAKFFKGAGLSKAVLAADGRVPCIHYGQLFTDYGPVVRSIKSFSNGAAHAVVSVANDVLMPTSDVTPTGLAKASCVLQDGVALGGDILVIRCDPQRVHGPFLSNLIRSKPDRVLEFVTGSTVFHLYARDMSGYELNLPDMDEQRAIAQVLSDMDADITALESRLTKARALKQAMAQALLTGRIRLVGEGAAT